MAIAITDHHDFCFVDYVRRAIARLPSPGPTVWLFPGVEVSCNDAVQCLVLFDGDTDAATWNRLFGGHLLTVQAPDPNAPTNPQADNCGKNISEFLEGVAGDVGLNGCSIVLPHASNEGAHKSMLRVGFHPRFKQLPFDGVYTERAFNQLDDITKKKIYGQITEWGNRRRGIIPTGDNRVQSFNRLATNLCWIRLGEPTAEAIRQAVLADEARISYVNPSLPNQRILSLKVESSLTGRDFELLFNDGFTALIGGRGSGKSAILEYLRFGLGRSAGDVEADVDEGRGHDDGRSREEELITETLQDGGLVVVVLERDGVIETWSRAGSQRDTINVTIPDGSVEELTISAAQQRFRGRAFYQKQLSTLVLDRRRAAEQITGIAAAESVDRRRLIDQDIAGAKREVEAAFQQLIEFWVAQAEHEQGVNGVADLNRRLAAVRKRLEESGLTPESQRLLDAAPVYNLVQALTAEAEGSIAADITNIRRAMGAVPSIDPERWAAAREFEEVAVFLEAVEKAKADVAGALTTTVEVLDTLARAQETLNAAFTPRHYAFNTDHQAAAAQQASLGTLIEESTRLVAELQTAEAAERRSAAKLKGLEEAPNKLQASREKLARALEGRRDILAAAAAQVEGMSAGSLRAEIRIEELPDQYVRSLVDICDGHRIRDLQARCEDRIRALFATGSDVTWHQLTDLVSEVYRHKLQTNALTIEPGEQVSVIIETALFAPLTNQQLRGIYATLDNTRVVKMLTASHEDYISFEYNDASGYIPFERASPGQQAAALLHLLLNQEAGTLVIDQPEDDLDNKVVMRIVNLVQTTKRKRQLIFATHNPNFVVNGDADKVVALTSGGAAGGEATFGPRVSIDVDGAIETSAVRTAITDTMEGGQAAFELRSRKYLFKL
jgi:ABC-type lipoprotein export system ATPase subunit/uncharacterized protein with GYD domain